MFIKLLGEDVVTAGMVASPDMLNDGYFEVPNPDSLGTFEKYTYNKETNELEIIEDLHARLESYESRREELVTEIQNEENKASKLYRKSIRGTITDAEISALELLDKEIEQLESELMDLENFIENNKPKVIDNL